MVVGEKFAWAHLARTGGTVTQAMFDLFPGLVLFADPQGTNEAHTRFPDRAEDVRGKVLAMNMRRLPSYVLSWAVTASMVMRADGKQAPRSRPTRWRTAGCRTD